MKFKLDFAKVGSRIRQARLEKGLTQEQLAEMVGLSNEWVSQLEKGKKLPLETLMRFSLVLEQDPNYFLMDTQYVPSDILIDRDLAKKLSQCDITVLNSINQMIDILLAQHHEDLKEQA